MENLVFTQLSIPEVRQLFRQELEAFFAEHALNTSQPETDQIAGIDLAQEITGLAKPTIYGLVAQSKIPHMKRGKLLYFSKQELMDWIKQGRRKTVADMQAEADSYLSGKRKRG
ncbi:MAG: helix-turn-helix domain-containing protein [Acidobacteria bacterium]|jgi:excisionase family DNA binding protein|nr:helix-turn-helix domain-containing protein [Acidobacteriota bacterium]